MASGSEPCEHGPGVAFHSDLEVGLFENLDLAGLGTDGRGALPTCWPNIRQEHAAATANAANFCMGTILVTAYAPTVCCLSLLSSRFSKSGRADFQRAGGPVVKERKGGFGGWFGSGAARSIRVGVVTVFGGLGWMQRTARRRGGVVHGQFGRRVCLQIVDDRLNDGWGFGVWCFWILFAHNGLLLGLRVGAVGIVAAARVLVEFSGLKWTSGDGRRDFVLGGEMGCWAGLALLLRLGNRREFIGWCFGMLLAHDAGPFCLRF